jgi:cytochrome c oxidase cbb3-type subunit 3
MAGHNPWPNEGNTGHIWDDDIRELDNPPPLWWMLAFYAGFVMIIFYAVYYPTIPLASGFTKGVAGWTAIKEYEESYNELKAWRQHKFADKEEKLASLPLADIMKSEDLKLYAVATSKMLFGDNCAACHGAGGMGNPNFPVLADDDWLWGGHINQIYASIANGRVGNMPARGLMGNLTDDEIEKVTDYVMALAEGKGNDPQYAAGKAVYAKGMCLACHGPTGKPVAPNGAANLTDSIWRFVPANDGSCSNMTEQTQRDAVLRTIKYGVNVKKNGHLIDCTRKAVMPAWKERLGEKDVKRLTVYVHQLGGGQ